MAVELPFATPDFDRIRRDAGIETEDAIRLIWLMLQDEINRRERLAASVGGTTGHNLLSATHPDTIPADPVQGDIITALGSTPVDAGKYWLGGSALLFEDLNDDTGGLDFWLDGSGFVMGGFSSSSGSGTKWQRKAIGAAGLFLGSTGAEVDWLAPSTASEQASAYRTSNLSVSKATDTAITFDATHFDTASFWSSLAPTRLTVPTGQGGKYIVLGQITWLASVTAFTTKIRLNGTTVLGAGGGSDVIGLNDLPMHVGVLADLAAGDYIELIGYWNYSDAGPRTVVGGSRSTFLQLVKVG